MAATAVAVGPGPPGNRASPPGGSAPRRARPCRRPAPGTLGAEEVHRHREGAAGRDRQARASGHGSAAGGAAGHESTFTPRAALDQVRYTNRRSRIGKCSNVSRDQQQPSLAAVCANPPPASGRTCSSSRRARALARMAGGQELGASQRREAPTQHNPICEACRAGSPATLQRDPGPCRPRWSGQGEKRAGPIPVSRSHARATSSLPCRSGAGGAVAEGARSRTCPAGPAPEPAAGETPSARPADQTQGVRQQATVVSPRGVLRWPAARAC